MRRALATAALGACLAVAAGCGGGSGAGTASGPGITPSVPSVVGLPLGRAAQLVRQRGLRVTVVRSYGASHRGTVFRQEPQGGNLVRASAHVRLHVSRGGAFAGSYVGLTLDRALARARRSGLAPVVSGTKGARPGTAFVLRQRPLPGWVRPGSQIRLVAATTPSARLVGIARAWRDWRETGDAPLTAARARCTALSVSGLYSCAGATSGGPVIDDVTYRAGRVTLWQPPAKPAKAARGNAKQKGTHTASGAGPKRHAGQRAGTTVKKHATRKATTTSPSPAPAPTTTSPSPAPAPTTAP